MITYRDMTFCASDCTTTVCFRHRCHTEGNTTGLPVCQANFSHDCPEYRAPSTENKDGQ